jgi:predicted negative regulator of RcsB-dependent stress response
MPKTIKKRSLQQVHHEEGVKGTVEDIRTRIKDQQRTLIIALAAFLVVIIAVGGFYVYNKWQGEKAEALQLEAYRAFYNEAGSQALAPGENYKKALDLYKKSYDTKKKADVLLYVAYCQYGLGYYDDTIATLKEFNGKFSDPAITPLAYYKLAEAYLKKNDNTNALAALNSITGGIYQDLALMQAAKIYELQGKTAEAAAKYKELIAKFPKSIYTAEAKTKVKE